MELLLRRILEHPNLTLGPATQPDSAGILHYLTLWKKWNHKVNLTSEKDFNAFLEKHFFDSLQFCRAVKAGGICLRWI